MRNAWTFIVFVTKMPRGEQTTCTKDNKFNYKGSVELKYQHKAGKIMENVPSRAYGGGGLRTLPGYACSMYDG